MRTVPLTVEHARDVAALHIQGIDKGFISSLGIKFVTALYEAIARSGTSFGYAAEDDGRVCGFVTFTTSLNRLYKSVIAKGGWRFAVLLAGKMFSVRRIKRILETILYPSRVNKKQLADAELLSIVIHPEKCKQGLATELVRKSFERCRQLGLDKVKVLVGADNEPANRLYQKCGFAFVEQIENHGVPSNIYEADVNRALDEVLVQSSETRHYSITDFDAGYPVKAVSQEQLTRVA
jgi:ribosomal protein S18 acetylase RimI-like enzyme